MPLIVPLNSVNKNYLFKLGWTRTMIDRLLGEPDRKITLANRKRTPRSDERPECHYDIARVVAAMESSAFQEWLQRLDRRRSRELARIDNAVPSEKSDQRAFWITRNVPDPPTNVGGIFDQEDTCTIHRHAFQSLSKRDRSIVKRLLDTGLSQREVADRSGISQQTVSLVKRRFLASINLKSVAANPCI